MPVVCPFPPNPPPPLISPHVTCPATAHLQDGYSYERTAIEAWINTARQQSLPPTSPRTNEPLDHCYLTPNKNLKILIDEYRLKNGWGLSHSPAKKQQRVSSPTVDELQHGAEVMSISPPRPSASSAAAFGTAAADPAMAALIAASAEEQERRALQQMIDQQLAEIQSMIWKLPAAPAAAATSKPATPPRPAAAASVSAPHSPVTTTATSAISATSPVAAAAGTGAPLPAVVSPVAAEKTKTPSSWTTIVQSTKKPPAPAPAPAAVPAPSPVSVPAASHAAADKAEKPDRAEKGLKTERGKSDKRDRSDRSERPSGPKPERSERSKKSAAAAVAAATSGGVSKAYMCPASRVRYVIGTKGVILKRLMSQSGATITTATSDVVPAGKSGNDSTEQCQIFQIKGTKEAVAKAEDLIASVIADGAKALAT